jgi:type IV secretory pathway VirB2 component (pilin)
VSERTDEELEKIADMAADKAVEKALQKMYVEIGKGVLKKAAAIIGIIIIAAAIWARDHFK